ncbi:MAG TPA: hypothetical protein VEZ20_03265 [Allosphingosinicella sp.]|jgi:hypothetical protein|nr:hypothetical protein [Allosphingosinicella sp.]
MIILKSGQAEDWIAAARSAGKNLVIVVGERVEAHAVDRTSAEKVAKLVRAAISRP